VVFPIRPRIHGKELPLRPGAIPGDAFLAIFAAAFTPIPYKVFTVASGVFETSLGVLVSASVLGRGLRFFGVALVLRWLGPPAKHFIDRYFNLLTVLFFVLLVLGFWIAGRFF
jgi:hypothetical protein